ncbi:DUF6929 family protein [Pontibacter roseus]|uniref:DUF6929 family protein n=1 Tax=Pontibacter roseus TaxID=336989 RepID=UPI0003667952|nr:hypothetical protein [Pontibacter roseus]
MKATIEKVLLYDSLPSASGLELLGDQYYVIGDDSPYLYRLDEDYKLLSQVALFDTTGFGATGRIAKSEKPDLESMTLFQYQGKPYLLMLGSGSSPERRKAFLSNICGDSLCREGSTTKEVDLDALYKQLETQEVLGESTLNIEGVAAGHGKLYLLQRAIGSGQNVLITFSLGEFIPYLLGESGGRIPKHELAYFRLPELKNLQAGFSGAFVYDDKLFFTASLEDTQDAIGDGEVLGSYVGFIPFREIGKQDSLEVPATLIVQADGKPYAGKAESLVVKKREGKGRYRLVVVSDDDKGGSELLEISLTAGQ